MIAPYKIFNLTMLRRQKLQFLITPLYGPTKLLDPSKALWEMTHIKIKKEEYKFLNSWTIMEETSENTTGSGCELEYIEEKSDNGNDEQSYYDKKQRNDYNC